MEKAIEESAAVVINENLFVVGGSDGNTGEPLSAVICFNLQEFCWKALPKMSLARSACAVAANGDVLYVVGGKASNEGQSALANAERMNTKTKVWEALPSMKYQRSHCAAAMLNDMFFA